MEAARIVVPLQQGPCVLVLAAGFAPLIAAAALPKYQIIDLGTLGGGHVRVEAINDAGQVTGYATTADGHAQSTGDHKRSSAES